MSATVAPNAPTMYTGGNLVNSINASYQVDFAQKQSAYATASDALQAMQLQISKKQDYISDQQTKKAYHVSQSEMWFSRHSGCGPFSRYSCGECENGSASEDKEAAGCQANIDSANQDIATWQGQISSYLQPQLNAALASLNQSYASYTKDISAAQLQEMAAANAQADAERKRKETELQSDPVYVASQNAAKAAAAAAALAAQNATSQNELAKTTQSNKKQLQTYLIVAAAVVMIAVITVFGIKILRK